MIYKPEQAEGPPIATTLPYLGSCGFNDAFGVKSCPAAAGIVSARAASAAAGKAINMAG